MRQRRIGSAGIAAPNYLWAVFGCIASGISKADAAPFPSYFLAPSEPMA